MKKIVKHVLGSASLAAFAMPVIAMVSCSKDEKKDESKKDESKDDSPDTPPADPAGK